MTNNNKFNYDEIFMGVFQDRPKGFYKKTYKQEPELRRLVEMVRIKKGRMLDIGSGGGTLTECLPYYFPKVRIFGCDISKSAIKYAKKFGTGKVAYKTNTKKLPYPNDYFDACTCSDVLEHIPDADYFLDEVKRVLKKDGIFFLAIPCEGQPFTIHWFFGKLGIWKDLTFKNVGHVHPEFTHTYIVRLFQNHGFTVLQKKYNERWLIQFMRYAFFMVPKEILEAVVGKKKAEQYYDRNVVVSEKRNSRDVIMIVRLLWFRIHRLFNIIYDIDAEFLTHISFGAGKIFILVRNNKQ